MERHFRGYTPTHGTESTPFETHVISLYACASSGVQRLEEFGVIDVIVGFRWPHGIEQDTEPLQTKIDNMTRFADDVMVKSRPTPQTGRDTTSQKRRRDKGVHEMMSDTPISPRARVIASSTPEVGRPGWKGGRAL
jgi:hypothetical protein